MYLFFFSFFLTLVRSSLTASKVARLFEWIYDSSKLDILRLTLSKYLSIGIDLRKLVINSISQLVFFFFFQKNQYMSVNPIIFKTMKTKSTPPGSNELDMLMQLSCLYINN